MDFYLVKEISLRQHRNAYCGITTFLTHYTESDNPENAHISPIYQNSVFTFKDTESGAAIASGAKPGYYYTRLNNPNFSQLARKLAGLEAWDLLRQHPEVDPEEIGGGLVFASGMAAVTAAILACAGAGDTVLTQAALYDGTFLFLKNLAPRYGIKVVWVRDNSLEGWAEAFKAHPKAKLAYIESPVNPTLRLTDIAGVVALAHRYGAQVAVDNTFAPLPGQHSYPDTGIVRSENKETPTHVMDVITLLPCLVQTRGRFHVFPHHPIFFINCGFYCLLPLLFREHSSHPNVFASVPVPGFQHQPFPVGTYNSAPV